MTQAGRVLQYDYDSTGRVKKVTDPFGRTAQFLYDSAGRVVTQTLPDGRVITYGYDANGNLTALTPPTKPAHGFSYTAANQDSLYTPPAAGLSSFQTKYTYNLDRQLTQILRPDSQTIAIAYDTAGRPSTLTLPNGSSTFGYSPTTGLLTSLTAPTGGALAFTYDGSLPKTATWSGPVAGSVNFNYDASFRVTSITVNGANAVSFGYDNDDLLTTAGSLSLSRDPQNGRLTETTLGSLTTAHAYDDSVGTLTRSTAKFSTDTLLDFQYTRDTLDRITQLVERVQGTTQTWDYAYDSVGWLDQVRLGGVLVSDYSYDGNGNRVGLTTPSGSVTGRVDDQDRLLSYGSNTYAYTSNGELKRKIAGTDTTQYTYDVLGNLRQVQLPSGTVIDYLVDGQNRRIGRKVNGGLVQGFLYQGQLAPIAELNASNQVVSRFVYGTRVNVPEYLIKAGVTYRLLTDHLGSVRLVVNTSTGSTAQRLDYDEFGRVTQNTNPGFQPFGFAGGLYDDSTKLVRFGARDYDAETGRWTAKDPIGFAGGDANLFTYAGHNPVGYFDPDGLMPSPGDEALDFYVDIIVDPTSSSAARMGAYVGAAFASLWTCDTWSSTATVLAAATPLAVWSRRPFWRYVGPKSKPRGGWLTRGRGWKTPYGTDYAKAKDALQLPNMPTGVERVQPKWWEPIIGPRSAVKFPKLGSGGGPEYWRGWRFPK